MGIDGDYGRGTDAALVEAFGGDEFRTLAAAAAVERLQSAQPPEGKRGEHALRYGEMFRDGLLDMTLGIGYDEALEQDPDAALNNYRAALAERGFTEDAGAAVEVYRQAGRSLVCQPYSLDWEAVMVRLRESPDERVRDWAAQGLRLSGHRPKQD